jgi:hypothetical protein
MNFVYTPNDIAVFLLKANFSFKEEQSVLKHLWNEQKHISKKYRNDLTVFIRAVRVKIDSYALTDSLDELDLIMRDINPKHKSLTPAQEHDCILHFFMVVRLELLYIKSRDYFKIKLRRLLKRFNYKRRTQSFMQDLSRTMIKLSLRSYLRDYVPCNLSAISLDDMVMIRLKNK